MTASLAEHEEQSATLEEFSHRAGCHNLALAADTLANLYDATENSDRRLLRGWIVGGATTAYAAEAGYEHTYPRVDMPDHVHYVRRETVEDKRRAKSYADYMANADEAWSGVVDPLNEKGVAASVWQTGGGCLAIGITMPGKDGRYVMLTDHYGPLMPSRDYSAFNTEADPPQWMIGFYKPEPNDHEGSVVFTSHFRADEPEQDAAFSSEIAALAKAWIAGEMEY